jgi:hypothetical protein
VNSATMLGTEDSRLVLRPESDSIMLVYSAGFGVYLGMYQYFDRAVMNSSSVCYPIGIGCLFLRA